MFPVEYPLFFHAVRNSQGFGNTDLVNSLGKNKFSGCGLEHELKELKYISALEWAFGVLDEDLLSNLIR